MLKLLLCPKTHIHFVKYLLLLGVNIDQTGIYFEVTTSIYFIRSNKHDIAGELGYEDMIMIHLGNAVGRDILSLPVKNTSKYK